MFLGHFGVGFALKRVSPRVSLGWLVAAVQLPDLLWPIFLLRGWETVAIDPGNTRVTPLAFVSYPYSHSLLLVVVWGVVLGALYYSRQRRTAAAVVIAAAVITHWLLDWITHRPDLPITPWSTRQSGLALWNSIPGTLAVEGLLYVIGVGLYARGSRARKPAGRAGLASLVVVLAAIYAANLLGPPPPDTRTLAYVTLGLWLFPFWAAWVDRGRVWMPAAHDS